MKWFRHETDTRQDFKIKRLTKRFGMEGYGVYWSVIELLAFETKDNVDVKLPLDDFPIDDIAHDLGMESVKLKEILDFIAKIALLDNSSYMSNVLYCKALSKRADDYAQRQGRTLKRDRIKSEHSTNNVPLQERTREDIREQERTLEELWNTTQLPRILSWSSVRKDRLRVRLQDPIFVKSYPEAIIKLSNSDFACGKGNPRNPGDKPWVATIDWFLSNDNNYLKVLEGKYDNTEARSGRFVKQI